MKQANESVSQSTFLLLSAIWSYSNAPKYGIIFYAFAAVLILYFFFYGIVTFIVPEYLQFMDLTVQQPQQNRIRNIIISIYDNIVWPFSWLGFVLQLVPQSDTHYTSIAIPLGAVWMIFVVITLSINLLFKRWPQGICFIGDLLYSFFDSLGILFLSLVISPIKRLFSFLLLKLHIHR